MFILYEIPFVMLHSILRRVCLFGAVVSGWVKSQREKIVTVGIAIMICHFVVEWWGGAKRT